MTESFSRAEPGRGKFQFAGFDQSRNRAHYRRNLPAADRGDLLEALTAVHQFECFLHRRGARLQLGGAGASSIFFEGAQYQGANRLGFSLSDSGYCSQLRNRGRANPANLIQRRVVHHGVRRKTLLFSHHTAPFAQVFAQLRINVSRRSRFIRTRCGD